MYAKFVEKQVPAAQTKQNTFSKCDDNVDRVFQDLFNSQNSKVFFGLC